MRLHLVGFSAFLISWPLLAENIWLLGSSKAGKSAFIAAALDYMSEDGGLKYLSDLEEDEDLNDFMVNLSRRPFLPVTTNPDYAGQNTLSDIEVSGRISTIPIPENSESELNQIPFNTTSVVKRYKTKSAGVHFVDTPGLTSENASLVGETMRYDILEGNSVNQIIAFIQLDPKIENEILTSQESRKASSVLLLTFRHMFEKVFFSDKITLQVNNIMAAIQGNLDVKNPEAAILFVFVPSHSERNPFEKESVYQQIEKVFEGARLNAMRERFLAAGITLTSTKIAAAVNDWGCLYNPSKPLTLSGVKHYFSSLVKILLKAENQRGQNLQFVESQPLIKTRTALRRMHSDGSFLNTFDQSQQQIITSEERVLSELTTVNRDLNRVKENLDALVESDVAKEKKTIAVDDVSFFVNPGEKQEVKDGRRTTTTSASDANYTIQRLYFSKNDRGEAGVFVDHHTKQFSLSDLGSFPTLPNKISYSLHEDSPKHVFSTNLKFKHGGDDLNYRFELHGDMDKFSSRTLGNLLHTGAGYIPFHFRSSAISREHYALYPKEEVKHVATKNLFFEGVDSSELQILEENYKRQAKKFRSLNPAILENKEAYQKWASCCDKMNDAYQSCLTCLTNNGIKHPKKFLEMRRQYEDISADIDNALESLRSSTLHQEAIRLQKMEAEAESKIRNLSSTIFRQCKVGDSFPCNSASYSFTKYEDLDITVYSDVVQQSINRIIEGLYSDELSFQIDTDGTIVYRSTDPELLKDLVNTLFVPNYVETPRVNVEETVEPDPEPPLEDLEDKWLKELRNRHSDEDHIEFFKHVSKLPDRIVVLHAWEPNLDAGAKYPFGHISLQIGDKYLSVHGSNGSDPYLGHSYATDAEEINSKSQFLVLKFDENDTERIDQMISHIEEQVRSGSLKYKGITQHISIPVTGDHKINFDIQAGGRVKLDETQSNINDQISDRVKQRIVAAWHQQARLYSYKYGSLFGLVGLASVGVWAATCHANVDLDYCYPEGDKPLTIKHQSHVDVSKYINSSYSVLSSLEAVLWMGSLINEDFKLSETKEEIFLKAKGSYNTKQVAKNKNDIKKCYDSLTHNMRVEPCGKENKERLDLVTSCLKENGHWKGKKANGVCEILRDSVKSLGKSDNIEQSIDDLMNRISISEGRLALLFGNPNMFPEGIMRQLARRFYQSKSSAYVYSSYEASLAPLLGTKVRIKNVASDRYLCAKDGSYHPWNQMVYYDYNDSNDKIFWMLPVGRDGKFYVLLNDKNKKALDLKEANSDRGTPLIVYYTHFGDSEQFRFVPEKSGDKDCVRIVTRVGDRCIGADTKDDGSSVRTWDWIDNDSQRWIIEPVQ